MEKEKDFNVTLLGYTSNAQTLSTAGALGCFEEESSEDLAKKIMSLPPEERAKKEKGVLKNSFGRGHGSVGDQNYFIFSIKNLPRIATLQLCLPEYASHLQQSLRRAKASKGFYLPEIIRNSGFNLGQKSEKILLKSFELYEKMCQAGIPGEDARFILPLYTKTNIQTALDARELCHLWWMSQGRGVPSIIRAVLKEMMECVKKESPYLLEDFGFNFEPLSWFPAAQLFSLKNETIKSLAGSSGKKEEVILISQNAESFPMNEEAINKAVKERNEAEMANLKHIHFEFMIFISLAAFHQAIRQRTWNQSIEAIYDAVKEALVSEERMAIPPSIKNSDFYLEYKAQHEEMMKIYHELVSGGIPESEAIGVIPHSLKVYDFIHVNGWNAIHSIGKRTCTTAQWEIRRIAKKIAEIIKEKNPYLGKWAEPQCVTYGKCPETQDCGYYKRFQQ